MNDVERAWAAGFWLVRLPLLNSKQAMLRLPRGLKPDEWHHFQQLLDAMRPGLVDDSVEGAPLKISVGVNGEIVQKPQQPSTELKEADDA